LKWGQLRVVLERLGDFVFGEVCQGEIPKIFEASGERSWVVVVLNLWIYFES
jgi:hypothetical protein